MKIEICGPSGAGKTTMAKYIAELLKIPYVRTRGEELRAKYHCKSHKEVIQMSALQPERGYTFQKELLAQRLKLVDENESLVMDRSLVDNVSYFLLQNSPYCSSNTTHLFITQALVAMPKFTHIIMVPPLYDTPEEDGVRIQNIYYQRMTWNIMKYAAEEYFRLSPTGTPKLLLVDTYGFPEREAQVREFFKGELI